MKARSFKSELNTLYLRMRRAKPVKPATWQSIDVSQKPEATLMELCNVHFNAEMPTTALEYYRQQLTPNLPWADRHFVLERISGKPINPGETWKEWPGGNSAEKFLRDGVFSHTYAERYWPKSAGYFETGLTPHGIRYEYGDLKDVVKLLVRDPLTRQAYLPIWFPEDTGVVHGERVPCTLGYHFWMRENRLNVFYPIRSCDYVNHFRDDLYLTVRLVLWMLKSLREISGDWKLVEPGVFSFWAGSLHCFINSWNKLYVGKEIS